MAPELPCTTIDRKQKRLTPEQETCARQFACERIAAIFVPETDERAAEEHLRLAYQEVGLAPPRVRWFDSPWAVNQTLLSESVSEDEQGYCLSRWWIIQLPLSYPLDNPS